MEDVREEQDWRLVAELGEPEARSSLDRLLARVRSGDELVKEVETGGHPETVITHDGRLLFAYAYTQQALMDARERIEAVLRRDGIQASIRVSHWDGDYDRWLQTDPSPTAEQAQADALTEHAQDIVETRTLVGTVGRLVRAEYEQTMREWADRLGLRCEVIEHPHLLTTQVGFTVTGRRHKLDEFSKGLQAEGRTMVRTEAQVMASPL